MTTLSNIFNTALVIAVLAAGFVLSEPQSVTLKLKPVKGMSLERQAGFDGCTVSPCK
jgi:hypothetical protein